MLFSPLSNLYICLGGLGGGGTPDPIPNSEVKPSIADDTAVQSWESRSPPRLFFKRPRSMRGLSASERRFPACTCHVARRKPLVNIAYSMFSNGFLRFEGLRLLWLDEGTAHEQLNDRRKILVRINPSPSHFWSQGFQQTMVQPLRGTVPVFHKGQEGQQKRFGIHA